VTSQRASTHLHCTPIAAQAGKRRSVLIPFLLHKPVAHLSSSTSSVIFIIAVRLPNANTHPHYSMNQPRTRQAPPAAG